MRTRIYSWLAILGGLLSFQGSCNQNCEWRYENDYVRLIIPYQLFPVADTMFVGDTLQLEMDFSEELQVHEHRNRIPFENYDFALSFYIVEASEELEQYSISYADIIPEIGEISAGANSFTGAVYTAVNPIQENGRYRFKMRIVLKEAGLFKLALYSFVDDRFVSHPLLTRCANGRGDRVSTVSVIPHNEFGSVGNLNFLVNNAGVSHYPEILELDMPPIISSMGVRVLER